MMKTIMSRMTSRSGLVTLAVSIAAFGFIAVWAHAETGKAQTQPYRSPFDAAFSPCGKMLAVSDRTADSLSIIDPAAGKVTGQIALNAKPEGLAWLNCQKVVVAEHGTGTVAEVDVKAGKVARRFATGNRPVAVAQAAKRKLLLVTNAGTNDVSVIDLSTGKETARVPVLREPRSIAISADEKTALIGNFLPATAGTEPTSSAAISVIDLDSMKRTHDIRLPAGGTLLREIAISPCGCWAYVAHTVGRFNIPTTQLERGWVNTNAISLIDLKNKQLYATVLLDHPSQGSADPWGLVLAKDGKTLWCSIAGVHKVARIDLDGLHKLLAGDFSKHPRLANPDPRNPGPQSVWLEIKKDPKMREQLVNELAALYAADLIISKKVPGNGPRGIDLSPDGKCLAVAMYFTGDVVMLDPSTLKPSAKVSLGPSPKPDVVRRGEMAFHDGTLCFQQWLSCATCHPGGRVDGLNWDLLNDGMGNPKNTKTMVWSHKTPPAMSLGVRANMDVAAEAGFKHILFRVPEPDELESTKAYLRSLEPAVSPHRQPNGELTAQAKRGEALFKDPQTRCATCHPVGLYTDLKLYDVGTRGELDRKDHFDTPTLVELWRTGPYLHNGAAVTLRDVLTTFNKKDQHGATSQLSKEQIEDLAVYLLSL
ncbi:MAG: hypothetical protein JXQ73_17440 [Phycisphaerae bacterium]|nr:hypothetical protein [Phycisphaerae bacterium]